MLHNKWETHEKQTVSFTTILLDSIKTTIVQHYRLRCKVSVTNLLVLHKIYFYTNYTFLITFIFVIANLSLNQMYFLQYWVFVTAKYFAVFQSSIKHGVWKAQRGSAFFLNQARDTIHVNINILRYIYEFGFLGLWFSMHYNTNKF